MNIYEITVFEKVSDTEHFSVENNHTGESLDVFISNGDKGVVANLSIEDIRGLVDKLQLWLADNGH